MRILGDFMNRSKNMAITKGAEYLVTYLQKEPHKHYHTIMHILETMDAVFDSRGRFRTFMEWVHENPGSRTWFFNLLTRDQDQVTTFVRNFLGNSCLKWMDTSEEFLRQYGCCPPYNILISPTMRCNLTCRGCYAASYGTEPELDFRTLDRIVTEGKSLAVYFYTILGGEPLLRFDDLETLAAKHADCLFQVFTNGTLLDADLARRLARLKNIVVAISISGTKEETDFIRGPGVYEKVLDAMALLRNHRQLYGISLTLTSHNYATFMSRKFLKFWEAQGVVFGWNFLFMPVGKNPDLSLMPTPQQRLNFGEFIKEYREQEPFYLMDFWADAPTLGGCIAAGRRYLHINAHGDIEPCVFAHFSTHNIKNCRLIDALQSPFFTFIRTNQPHNDNLLRPCMIIDNPEVLREACRRFHARPTEAGAEALLEDPMIMKFLDRYAAEAAKVIDPFWENTYREKIGDIQHRQRSYREGLDRIEFKLDRSGLLERIKMWALDNPAFVRAMLDGLEFGSRRLNKDAQRLNQPKRIRLKAVNHTRREDDLSA